MDYSSTPGFIPDNVYNASYLIGKGLNPETAESAVANFQRESNNNSLANNPNDGGNNSYGLAQWQGPRLQALNQYAKENNLDLNHPDTQLDFFLQELNGTEKKAGESLTTAKDPQTRAEALVNYERPANISDAISKNVDNTKSIDYSKTPGFISDDQVANPNQDSSSNAVDYSKTPGFISDDQVANPNQDDRNMSKFDSMVSGLSSFPGAKQVGAAANAIWNTLPGSNFTDRLSSAYDTAKQNVENNQKDASEINPTTYGISKIAANTVPYLTPGLGELPIAARFLVNAGIGGTEALSDGATPTSAVKQGLATALLPEAIGAVVPPIANVIGNVGRGIGGIPGGAIKKVLGFVQPKINPAAFDAYESAGTLHNIPEIKSKLAAALEFASKNKGDPKAKADIVDLLRQLKNVQAENPLTVVNNMFTGRGGVNQKSTVSALKDALGYLSTNNPMNYGSLGKSAWQGAKEAAETAGTLIVSPHIGLAPLAGIATQYGGGMASVLAKIIGNSAISPAEKAAVIAAINKQHKSD